MNIFVCSKISIPARDRTLPAWNHLRTLGHNLYFPPADRPTVQPDAVISMGVTIMPETIRVMRQHPGVPLFCYNWDCYEWVWTSPRPNEYDYAAYGNLLRTAAEIWVPSRCTGLRTKQWWGLDNWHVILSSIPYWEYDSVRDDGYALCTLRQIPDPYWGRLAPICKDLGIPLMMTEHRVSYDEYKHRVARCKFLVSDLYELSTGGLTLLEGYYHGKPCLLSDSPWHGGRDYLGDRAVYFQHDSESALRNALRDMYDHTPDVYGPAADCKQYVVENFSDELMVEKMLARMEMYV